MIDPNTRKIMLKACARCHGDLIFDTYEEDFACMQCGRHFGVAAVLASQATTASKQPEVKEHALAA